MVEPIVAALSETPAGSLSTPRRGSRAVVIARQLAMYLLHTRCRLTLSGVAALYGRDRRTVAYAVSTVEARRDACPAFDRTIAVLEQSTDLSRSRLRALPA